ncbi:uncharacterized protein LOC108254853 isoform X2 [Ictalurus punctatus]|uniref:Uncharacterized protein LOC108254853 isoform X2 n=1 Tax=Ictalurus punctatus TaxID=7998 RepID=A0A9F7QPE8_ICTPU|nr:uncharacterized protein LOC108254853 isoform X2 [Ictalurus punctatus]
MLWQKRETWFMFLAVLILISSAFCLVVPKGKLVQTGRLIIGSSRITNETKNGIVKKVHDEYAGDTNGYQSDQPELTGSQLSTLMLRRWSPSVQCDDDSMSLHIQGSRVPNFLVETSEEGLVPLSQMPSHCGFSLRRAHREVALIAKYAGCNVAQQGNSYILPLWVSGVAVKMVCPVACPLTVSCSPSAMVVNLGVSTAALRLKVNGVWQPVYQASTCGFTLEVVGGGLTLTAPYASNCWQLEGAKMLLSVQYMDRELTLSCPAVQPPATTPLPAHMDPEASTDAPVTTLATTVAPASAYQLPFYPWLRGLYPYGYGMPWNFQNGHLRTPPVTHTTTTTPAAATTTPAAAMTTPAATVAPTSGQLPLYPWLSGMYNPYVYGMPWRFQHSQPGTPPVTQTTTTTPAATTTTTPGATVAPARADQLPLYPWLSGMYYPGGYGMPWNFPYSHPGTPPVTQATTMTPAATVVPASAGQLPLYPWLPGMYYPSGYGIPWRFQHSQPGSPPVTQTTTTTPAATTTTPAATSTTVAPARADQPLWYPWLPGMYKPYVPMGSPGVPVSDPNSGVKQQMYQMPWMNAFPQVSGLKSNTRLSSG